VPIVLYLVFIIETGERVVMNTSHCNMQQRPNVGFCRFLNTEDTDIKHPSPSGGVTIALSFIIFHKDILGSRSLARYIFNFVFG
jgi:hypothetical protein